MRLFSLLLFSLFTLAASAQNVYLKNGVLKHQELNLEEDFLSEAQFYNDKLYCILQFDEIPRGQNFKSCKVDLHDYLPEKAFISAVHKESLNLKTLKKLGVSAIYSLSADLKLDQLLLEDELPFWAVKKEGHVDLAVAIHKNLDLNILRSELLAMEFLLSDIPEFYGNINLSVPFERIEELAAMPFVYHISCIGDIPEPDDREGRSLHRSSYINNRQDNSGLHYDGSGINIAIADDGASGPHIDFKGRITQFNQDLGGTHGDMTNGIAMGAGNINPNAAGMATGAHLYTYNISNYPHVRMGDSNLVQREVIVTSTSYSQNPRGGIYSNDAAWIDAQSYRNPTLIHCFSAGNAGTTDYGYGAGNLWGNITGGYKAAKNVIATGNLRNRDELERSSSRGPAKDGRIKPDLCANGYQQLSTAPNNTYRPGGGTSAAAPGVAGVFAQLQHAYSDLNLGEYADAALIKCALQNGAEDLGRPGPDFDHGWGRLNVKRAFEIIEQKNYTSDTIADGQQKKYNIQIPTGVVQLKVMIHWTDPAGSPLASRALVNDLDMQVNPSSGNVHFPLVLDPTPDPGKLELNAVQGTDTLNNSEQVVMKEPAPGTYEVIIEGTLIPDGPQKFYITWLFEFDAPQITYPIGGEGFNPGEVELIRWDASTDTSDFDIDYSTDNGQTWVAMHTNLSPGQRNADWLVPDSLSGRCLVRVLRNGVSGVSPKPFSIARVPVGITLLKSCPDTVSLSWNAVPGALEYRLYKLGEKYMDHVATTTVNGISFFHHDPGEENWYALQAYTQNSAVSRRSNAFQILPGNRNCTILRDLNASSLIGLPSARVPECIYQDSMSFAVELENLGSTQASGFRILFFVDGDYKTDSIFQRTISPGGTDLFWFRKMAVNVNAGFHEAQAVVSYSNDQNKLNDTISYRYKVSPSIMANLPYKQQFEAFNRCSTSSSCEVIECHLVDGWANAENRLEDDIDWRVHSGGTPTNNTGPGSDHSPEPGRENYLYLEANGCNNKTALLYSPCFNLAKSTNPELSLWYHINGNAIGEFHLDMLTRDGIIEDISPAITESKGNSWQNIRIDLSSYVGQIVSFRMRGILASGAQGDMAIDDFEILENARFNVDVELLDIIQPIAANYYYCIDLSSIPVEFEYLNAGVDTLTQIPVAYQLDQGVIIRDTLRGQFLPLNSTTFRFKDSLDLSGIGAKILKVWSELRHDDYYFNDTIYFPTNVFRSIQNNLPFTEDFESFAFCSTASNCGSTVCELGKGWIQEENYVTDNFDLRLHAGGSPSGGTGPSQDHTPGIGNVKYIYTEASNGCYNQIASLISPCISLADSKKPVLRFWRHMNGGNIGTIRINVLSDSIGPDVLLPVSGSQGNAWIEDSVDLSPWAGKNVILQFHFETGGSWNGDMAIDDISVEDEYEYLRDAELVQIISPESFSIPDCQPNTNLHVEVRVGNAGMDTLIDIPIYCDTNGTKVLTDTIRTVLLPGTEVNFSFSRSLNIGPIGSYTLTCATALSSDEKASNNSGNIFLEKISGIILKAPMLENFDGFDLCSTAANCEDVICELSNGWANHTNRVFDNIDWRTHEGASPSGDTGPTTDKSGNGRYLYTEASGGSGGCVNREAQLLSPCIDLTGMLIPHLKFWYNMRGNSMGELAVDVFDGTKWTRDIGGQSLSGNQGSAWRPLDVDLFNYTGDTIILRFRGITGNGINSDIAIDEIEIYEAFSSRIALEGPRCPDSLITIYPLGDTSHAFYSWTFNLPPAPSIGTGSGPFFKKLGSVGAMNKVLIDISLGALKFTDSIEFEVEGPPVAGFTWQGQQMLLTFNNGSINAKKWFWDFGDGTTSSDSAPQHSYSMSGYYVVTQIASNNCSTDTLRKQVSVLVGNEVFIDDEIKVYPNPTKDFFVIELNGSTAKQIRIHDLNGKTLNSLSVNSKREKIDIRQFSSGTYIIEITSNDWIKRMRIIKE